MIDLKELSRRLNLRWFPPIEIRCLTCKQRYLRSVGW